MTSSTFQFRICWTASSNITFKGKGEWRNADDWLMADDAITQETIENALNEGGNASEGLALALEESGFEWWVEVKEEK